MLVMMMMSTNKPRRPQEPRPTSAAAQVSAGGVAAMSAAVSSSADQSAAPSTNLAAALGQLGKSSNSSNETVIALEQTTESKPRSAPLSAPPTSQISSSASTPLAEGEQLAEEKKPRLSKTTSNILKDDAPQMMIHNQDRRNAANVMTTVQTDQKVAEPQTDQRSDQDISSGEIRDNRAQQRRDQSIGRLRAFLLLTRSHLNPFHHDRQQQQQLYHKCNQTNIKRHQVKRKQSLDSSSCASAASSAASLVVANHPNHNPEAAAELATANNNSKIRAEAAETRTDRRADDDYSHRNEKKFVNLFNLAQRCFFFKQSSGEFSLNHHGANLEPAHNTSELAAKRNTKCKSSVSAPVTPIKWNPLSASTTSTSTGAAAGAAADCDEPDATPKADKQSEQIPNGLGSAPGGCLNTSKQQTNLTAKPSVRFVESCRNGGGGAATDKGRGREKSAGKWRAVHTQTSSSAGAGAAADQAEQQKQQPRQDCDDSSVANLFKLQDVVEEGESPMNSTSFRQHGYSLIDYISNYLDTIKERRVTPLNIEPGYLKDLIEPDAPERGESFANIMHDFENHIMCGITHWQHPHFHAYFPAGNAYPSILADMLSDALGCVGFSWAASPAYTELEIIMLDWMGKMIGLPDEFLCLSSSSSRGGGGGGGGSPATEEATSAGKPRESKGGGVIQGSASECVLVNLLAARHWAMEKLRKKHPHTHDGILLTKLIGYCSKEAHSCVEKAAMIGFIRMRALDTDEQHSLRGETLAKAIAMDKANGLEPFLVCATLGTTSCVSFDNLAELGPVCRDEDIWLHVDAAYAGSALICPEFQYLMKGIELVTSFNMNPNKWMLINFDCSLMWVKDRFKLTRAFVVDPLYLQHSFSDQAIDYRHWGIPLSRRFRALKLWFVIRNYGVAGLQAYIRNHVRLAKLFEQLIRQDSRFTINNQVVLGLVCFRLIGSNALNQRLLSMINASGKLHMVPASLEGRYVIRFCVCDQNAREEDIRFAYECIAQFATELFESIRAGRERIRAISQQNTIDVSSVSLHTQQSASADRLNRLATAGQPAAAPTGTPERDIPDDRADVSTPARAASSANREAARQYMMASRRSSHAVGETEQQQLPPGGAKSPLKKQASMQLAPVASCGEMEAAAAAADQDDLEQEIVLDSLASIDGFDYDLEDDDYEDGDEGDALDEAGAASGQVNEAPEERAVNQESSQAAASVEPGATAASRTPHLRRRLRSSHTTAAAPTSAFGGGAGERDEAEDEVFHLAKERRNRMSLRYKREFFVRVVSDPRVYRASISGDINASSNSLANQQQQSTTSVPRPLAPPPAKAAD